MQHLIAKALAFATVVLLVLACALPALAIADDEGASELLAGTIAAGEETAGSSGDETAEEADALPSVSYRAHQRKGAWKAWVKDGKKTASSASIDALRMRLGDEAAGSIHYQVYLGGLGWQAAKADGKTAGSVSGKWRIEAVRVVLAGELSKRYGVEYRIRTVDGTWQAWRADGEIAGQAGSGEALGAIRVRLVERQEEAAQGEGLVGVRYRVRMQSGSLQAWKANNATAGKASGSSRIRGLALSLDSGVYDGSIQYRVRLNSGNWQSWRKNGVSTSTSSRVEAVQVKLTGSIAEKYDVVYRVNIKGAGWQKRVRNGETAGTTNRNLTIRAIRVQLVEKSKRTGWVGGGTTWRWYENGEHVKSQWVVSKESPIDEMQGTSDKAQRYWIDSSGKLALDRIVNPKKARDAGAGFLAYAMGYGYIMTNQTRVINGVWYSADEDGVLTKMNNKKRKKLIAKYVNWALAIAADDSHGYSQKNRWGPDYDCSSFVVSALSNSGFEVGDAVWTGNMKSELTKYGFKWYTNMSKLKRGDILLVHNSSRQHTEIYLGNGKTVGAHIAETGGIYGVEGDQTGNEICVGPYYSIWEGYLRFIG